MSFHENTWLHVKSACQFEKEQAEKEWGKTFNSLHEGWAVLKEEIEEFTQEYTGIKCDFEFLWGFVKGNQRDAIIASVDCIQKSSIRAMMELAQVWAVCEKMRNTVKEQ